MYISKVRIQNYKSFNDSGEIEFKSGINLIVGQNNAGKTAMLETLGLKYEYILHKSIKPEITIGKQFSSGYGITCSVFVSPDELRNAYIGYIPYPQNGVLNKAADEFYSCLEIGITLTFTSGGKEISSKSLSYGLYDEHKGKALSVKKDDKDLYIADSNQPNVNSDEIFGWKNILKLTDNIYRFNAERFSLGKCEHGKNRKLKPNASNLAEVLQNTYLENLDLYEELISYVRLVIPSIKWIDSINIEEEKSSNILQTGNSKYQEVRIWRVERSSRKENSTVLLSESGTGISQVLAILYVVVTSKEPRTIIIDEPNSFLHPGAAKKLIQILNKFPQHQYFISTHSPEILSAAKPSTITKLKYIDGETIAKSINPEQTKDLRETLEEIGVKFADIFFSENILWVEGETEAKAFPLILETADELYDVTVLPLVHIDDLKQRKSIGKKHAKLVFEIYERLSGANALTPPFVAVILDRESSSQQERKKLTETFGNKLKFIPRMMYENYLLDAEAITNVLNAEIIEDDNKITSEKVEDWIEKKKECKFLSKNEFSKKVFDRNDWLKEVHAANLLDELFSELSGKTVEYRKTTHSIKLTQWLVENKPELLNELKDFLVNILSAESFS